MRATDPKANRYILKISATLINSKELLGVEHGNNETFVLFKIQGQSFMYHKIRKMIGMIIQIIQKNFPNTYIQNSFLMNAFLIWIAPTRGCFW